MGPVFKFGEEPVSMMLVYLPSLVQIVLQTQLLTLSLVFNQEFLEGIKAIVSYGL